MRKTNGNPARLTDEEFVRAWQKSGSAIALGMYARQRAAHFRKRGVPLKKFHAGRKPIDVARLKKIVEGCVS